MNGILEDVFELSGRGTVVLVQIRDGLCKVGDTLVIGEKQWPITGIELVNYGADAMRRMAEGWVPPVGILLGGALKSDVIDWVGADVSTLEQRKTRS